MNMKRRIAAFALLICLCVTAIMASSTVPVSAKAQPKLSAKSVTIAMGGTKKITLKNGKGKWTIQGDGVACISRKTKKYATITPLKSGQAVLTCKVGKKKLRCKVTVLNDSIGSVKDVRGNALVVGSSNSYSWGDKDLVFQSASSDTGRTSVTVMGTETIKGIDYTGLKVKALAPGPDTIRVTYTQDGTLKADTARIIVIKGFRGKENVRKTDKNYKAWRRKVISSMVTEDMTTWEIIDALGCLISTGRYSGKGGSNGKQLWYGGNGTCVSGAKMMSDFMKDLGIKRKIHFMGKIGGAQDIHGFSIFYASQHKNIWVKLGGSVYELNPQPEMRWPVGIVRRSSL